MKKVLFIVLLMMISVLASAADEAAVANIAISPDWGKAQCASQPGKGITLIWNGVSDLRTSPTVGILKKKDQEIEVKLAQSVDKLAGDALKNVFKNCGFEIKDKGEGVKTSVDVTELFAGSKKGFAMGETEAKGTFALHFNNNGASYDYNLGASKFDKKLKKKNVKQLEEVLTGLMETIVTQVGESSALFSELKRISGK
jgi:uncharacterized lipoprotein YajG